MTGTQNTKNTGAYRCRDCGQMGLTLDETFVHGELHRPFSVRCPDGYTRRFHTKDEADAAARGEVCG